MSQKQFSFTILAFVMAGLLFAACSTRTQTKAPATPSGSPPTQPPIATLPSKETIETEEGLDLVIFGDSSLWGVGKYYAAYIEEDLNKTVRLHDMWEGNLSAVALLEKLRENEKVQETVREAEIVVYFGNPEGSMTGDWQCIEPPYSVTDCSPDTFMGYRDTMKAIVDEIFALREGKPTAIRATDFYVPILSLWREAAIEEACTICLENFNEAVHQAAQTKNVPIANVYDAFNGSAHDEDSREKGYIGTDGFHATDLGRITIATLLRELGYEPVAP